MPISVSNTGILSSNTGLLDEIGQYMNFYDEANTTLYFDATGRFPYSTSTTGTWLNLAPTAKYIVANTTALGATVANTYGPNAMIFTNGAGTAGRIDRTAASNTLIVPGATSGTGKMTAAVWGYSTNWYQTTGQRFVSTTATGGWSIALNDSGFTGSTSVGIVLYNITAGGYRYMSANTRDAFTSSTGWNHLAWTFDGKNAYFYINGLVANTYTATAATNYIDVGASFGIGAESLAATTTGTPYLSGAIASIFVSNRTFTNTEIYNLFVDTDPNITLPGSRTYVVNSTYSTATTVAPNVPAKYYSNGALRTTGTIGFDEVSMNSGSLFFNGSTQYLTGPATPAALGTGNFTIEMWLNPTAVSSASGYCLLDARAAGSGSTGWVVGIQSGNLTIQNAGTQYLTSTGTISAGVWSHVAWVRSGTTVTVYINGVASGTATNSTDHTASLFGVAKPTFTSSSQLNYGGSISNLRIVPGIALYTSTFTPPRSSILEATANTSLLLQCANSTNYIVDSSPYQYTITNNGNVGYSPLGLGYLNNPPCGSLSFNGSNQNLTISSTSAVAFGTGDFTIEAWIYPGLAGGVLFCFRNYGPNFDGPLRTTTSGSQLVLEFSDGNVWYTGTTKFNANQWHHVALVRQSGTCKFFIDGVQDAATFSYGFNIGNRPIVIGSFDGGFGNYFPGYVTNLRVVKGTALYTSNFTPSNRVLTAVTNTTLLLQVANSATYITDSSSSPLTVTNSGATPFTAFTPFASLGEMQKTYSDGTISVPNYLDETLKFQLTASYLAVAGGGGGGTATGGGGGGGGVLTGTSTISSGNSYNVVVGPGGSTGTTGGNSSVFGVTAVGGGSGGNNSGGNPGSSGGSGGGGGWNGAGGANTVGQGYAGGSGANGPSYYNAGAGGGAGGVGGSAGGTTQQAPAGGIGIYSSISGSNTAYGGGGAGGPDSSRGGTGNSGGAGGGGASTAAQAGTAGLPNTGGGGGGGPNSGTQTGGAGGSGIVIISYPGTQVAIGGAVTTVGANTVHTFTSNGTFIC